LIWPDQCYVFGGITCLNILTLRCPAQPGLEASIRIE
jgi:hypothetical protein